MVYGADDEVVYGADVVVCEDILVAFRREYEVAWCVEDAPGEDKLILVA